jgi:hypothetical protein
MKNILSVSFGKSKPYKKGMANKIALGATNVAFEADSAKNRGKFTGTPERIVKADKRNAEMGKRKTFFNRLKEIGYRGAMPRI